MVFWGLDWRELCNFIIPFESFDIFDVLIKVDKHHWWRNRKNKAHGSGHLVVDSHEVSEVEISKFGLVQQKYCANRCESGRDVGSPVHKFLLDAWVIEFHFVLVGELSEKISSDFEIVSKTLDFLGGKIFLPKLSSNLVELVTDEIQNFFPSYLISGILHDIGNNSIFTSQVNGELGNNSFDGLMISVLRNEGLETKSEFVEVGSEHGSFVGNLFLGVWIRAVRLSLTAKNVVSSNSLTGKVHVLNPRNARSLKGNEIWILFTQH